MRLLSDWGNDFDAAHIGNESVGDDDRAVFLLVVFDDRKDRPADGQPAAVEACLLYTSDAADE